MSEQQARREYGAAAYRDIPKSVFALAAYHLADVSSVEGVGNGGALVRLRDEIEALAANGIITAAQHRRAVRALSAAIGVRVPT